MTRTRRNLNLELESLDGRVLLSSFAHVAAHRHAHHHAVVARHHHATMQATANAAATTELRGAFHHAATGAASSAQATPQVVAISTGTNGSTGTSQATANPAQPPDVVMADATPAPGTDPSNSTGVPSGSLNYGTTTTGDGSQVLARDNSTAPANSPSTSSDPQATPGVPSGSFNYGTAPAPSDDGGVIMARSTSSGFAPSGRPIPGHPGHVYGPTPTSVDGYPVNS